MAFTEDTTVFFDTDEFAVNAIWKGSVAVKVIFDNQYAAYEGVGGSAPLIQVPTADMPTAARGDAMVIEGVNYTIKQVEPDGTGVSRIELHKA